MKLERIKPISYFKANAAEILADIAETGQEMVITQNGEARAVIMDIASFERTQETLALLKLIALGRREIEEGKTRPAHDVFDDIKASLLKRR